MLTIIPHASTKNGYNVFFKRTYFSEISLCICLCEGIYIHIFIYIWVQVPRETSKKVLDTLELELHTVVSCLRWVLGPKLRSSVRTAHDLIPEPSLQPPGPLLFWIKSWTDLNSAYLVDSIAQFSVLSDCSMEPEERLRLPCVIMHLFICLLVFVFLPAFVSVVLKLCCWSTPI